MTALLNVSYLALPIERLGEEVGAVVVIAPDAELDIEGIARPLQQFIGKIQNSALYLAAQRPVAAQCQWKIPEARIA